MTRNTKFELEVFDLIRKHYKKIRLCSAEVVYYGDEVITLHGDIPAWKVPLIALRILNTYPQIRMVENGDYYITWVYTRETLRWAGYKVKQFKTK